MAVTQTGQSDEEVSTLEQPPGTDSEPKEWATFGAVVYGVAAVGMFLTFFLGLTIGDEESVLLFAEGALVDEEMFAAAAAGAEQLVFLAPLIAVGVGVYYWSRESAESPAKPAAIAAAVGTAVSLLLLTVLMMVFEPDMGEQMGMSAEMAAAMGEESESLVSIGDEIPTILAVAIGSAIAAALTGVVLEKTE
ncbi:hypothetical protein [Halovivax gelatinilyticus]|uniref:hypothetical protein n=1 Tax=Halovivax gelatinilyticus TaxID=2961597 RepID=UPI0020CA38F0|nr:hypothetical protein [Halovivax gelatinilyticus]